MRIGIAGSMQFTEKMLEAQTELQRLGHEAFVTGFASSFVGKNAEEIESIKMDQKLYNDPITEFWKLMQGADALLVMNFEKHGIPNYVGGNTLMEIGFAHVLRQKVFFLNPIPDIPYYKGEIESVHPVILDGDLTMIK